MYKIVDNQKIDTSIKNKSVAIFGGSFDPIHSTHISIAKYVHTFCNVDNVIIVPTKHNPLKHTLPIARSEARLMMIQKAINNQKGLLLCNYEIVSDNFPSYTYSTLEHIIKKKQASTPLKLILGADSIAMLHKWKNIEMILQWVELLVIPRRGYTVQLPNLFRTHTVKMEVLHNFPCDNVSSSDIRKRIHNKKYRLSNNMLSTEVSNYINTYSLYE